MLLCIARLASRPVNVRSVLGISAGFGAARRMSGTTTPTWEITPAGTPAAEPAEPPAPKPPAEKKELKVLMLHGYTQSGPLFRTKTRALEKLLAKSLDPKTTTLSLIYPTGPIRLSPSDIPGYTAPTSASLTTSDDPASDQIDSFAWFRRNPNEPSVRGLETGMAGVAQALREAGGVDGVVGFSQGGALAALVAAVLETPHRVPAEEDAGWVKEVREANGGRTLRFAVVYSGFWLPVEGLRWCYEPPIKTPTLHFLGGLDTVVEEARSHGLIERCEEPMVAVHPGGHYVPISREWVLPIVGFMKRFVDQMEPKI